MSENKPTLPAWDLSDMYKGIDDPQIAADMESYRKTAASFARKYKGRLAGLSAEEFARALEIYNKLSEMAGLLGGPANTTYGENTGVLALTKIYDPLVIRIAAVFACILSFCPKFEAIINTIPSGIIGGISFVLYGMISAIGVRNVVENQVDFTNSRNLIIAAVILVCALGFNSVGGITFGIGGVSVTLSGLAIAALAGILLNAILPGNDYEFDSNPGTGEGTSLRV